MTELSAREAGEFDCAPLEQMPAGDKTDQRRKRRSKSQKDLARKRKRKSTDSKQDKLAQEKHTYELLGVEGDDLSLDGPENTWINASYWYKNSPGDELASEYGPTKYPIFPPDYFNLDVPSDGSVEIIELKDPDTICPGSPGYLPNRILAKKWFHDVAYGRYEGNPYNKMVRYSELTSKLRIPVEEAKKQGLMGGSDKCWFDTVNWYGDILHGKDPLQSSASTPGALSSDIHCIIQIDRSQQEQQQQDTTTTTS